jgi:hypothetical protein
MEVTRYLYGMETGAPKIHDFMAHRWSNSGKTTQNQERCDKNLHFLVAPVIYHAHQ